MPRWVWMWRGRRRGRPYSCLILHSLPYLKEFIPNPCLNPDPIELTYPEYEVLRLMDLEGLTQEQAAEKMGTSRGTIWRLASSARRKIIQSLTESRPLILTAKGEVKEVREVKH